MPHRMCRTGFTLVEMLVAVAITLLIMTLFAQVFQIASGSMVKQRGIAENDQRARMITTTLRGDLDKRTFREVKPFRNGDDTRLPAAEIARRAGYFYIAENDHRDDTDDILQFTTRVSVNLQNQSDIPYSGRAVGFSSRPISNLTSGGGVATITVVGDSTSSPPIFAPPTGSYVWIFDHPNTDDNPTTTNDGRYQVQSSSQSSGSTTITVQASLSFPAEPMGLNSYYGGVVLSENDADIDDGVAGNNLGQSQAAEVCYYLRGGNLYRRVLLIREEGDDVNAEPRWGDGSSAFWNGSTSNFVPAANNRSFWGLFDYSAFHFRGMLDGGGTLQGQGVRFLSAKTALNNGPDAPEIVFDTSNRLPLSLGMPNFRFGFRPWNGSMSGYPAEFVVNPGPNGSYGDADDVIRYLGRFNLQECSHNLFRYPGVQNIADVADASQDVSPLTSGSTSYPFAAGYQNVTLDQSGSEFGVVDQFEGRPYSRRGEDILLSNVLSFDIKVYDPDLGRFVNLGDDSYTSSTGRFSRGNVQNTAYSPNSGNPTYLRYDTWHPQASIGGNTNPPFFSAVTAIQIQINYRDVSTGTVRQATIVQSLVDQNSSN